MLWSSVENEKKYILKRTFFKWTRKEEIGANLFGLSENSFQVLFMDIKTIWRREPAHVKWPPKTILDYNLSGWGVEAMLHKTSALSTFLVPHIGQQLSRRIKEPARRLFLLFIGYRRYSQTRRFIKSVKLTWKLFRAFRSFHELTEVSSFVVYQPSSNPSTSIGIIYRKTLHRHYPIDPENSSSIP